MDSSEPTPSSSLLPKMDEAGLTAAPPLVSQRAPIPPRTRKNRTFLIIMLITLVLLMLAAGVVLTFSKIITTAEVLQVDKDIQLPVSVTARRKEEPKEGEYALNVKWKDGKGVFRFLEKDYEDEQAVVAELAKLRTSVPGCRIIIRGDKRLPAMEIQRAMKVPASAGFDAITFSTLNQE